MVRAKSAYEAAMAASIEVKAIETLVMEKFGHLKTSSDSIVSGFEENSSVNDNSRSPEDEENESAMESRKQQNETL